MGVLAHLDPFRGENPSPAHGFLQLTGLGLFFYGLLYLLPAIFVMAITISASSTR